MRRKAWRCQGNLVKILGLLKVDQRDSFPPSNGDLLRQPYALALWNLIIRPPRRLRIFLFFLKLLFCSPFFGGDEVFLVITHLEFKPNAKHYQVSSCLNNSVFLIPSVFSWCLFVGRCPSFHGLSSAGAMIRGVWGRRSFGSGAAVSEGWKLGRFTKGYANQDMLF